MLLGMHVRSYKDDEAERASVTRRYIGVFREEALRVAGLAKRRLAAERAVASTHCSHAADPACTTVRRNSVPRAAVDNARPWSASDALREWIEAVHLPTTAADSHDICAWSGAADVDAFVRSKSDVATERRSRRDGANPWLLSAGK